MNNDTLTVPEHTTSLSHSPARRFRWSLVGVMLAAGGMMPGCIVHRINDNLELANAQMESINASIARMEVEIVSLRTVQLDDLYDRLRLLKSLDTTLVSLDEELGSVGASLKQVDDHLASLRRTAQNIDSTIPFVNIADDGDAGEPAAPPQTP